MSSKSKYLMNQEEKDKQVRKRMLRSATALYNACKTSYAENRCKGCPFDVGMGCNLYGHPINWNKLLSEAKTK